MKKNILFLAIGLVLLTSFAPQILTDSTAFEQTNMGFDQVLTQNKFVVIKFWMPGCPPCKSLAPRFETASNASFSQPVLFLTLNIRKYPEIANRYGIRSVPQILYINNGNVMDKQTGGNTSATQIQTTAKSSFGI